MHGIEVTELQIEAHHAVGSRVLVIIPSMNGKDALSKRGIVEAISPLSDGGYALDVRGARDGCGRFWSNYPAKLVIADDLEAA